MRLIAPLLIAALAAGCATWQRPNTSKAEFNEDNYNCQVRANQMYPVVMMQIGTGYRAPSMTSCTAFGNQMNCTTTPGTYTAPPQMDVNAFNRTGAATSCLEGKGYVRR